MRVHQAQVARHRNHVAVSAGVHGGSGGGGSGVALVVGPEHAHGRRRRRRADDRDRKSERRFIVNGRSAGREIPNGQD